MYFPANVIPVTSGIFQDFLLLSFNHSIRNSAPLSWLKQVNITPLLKKGGKKNKYVGQLAYD